MKTLNAAIIFLILITLSACRSDNVEIFPIQDNAKPRLMGRALFSDAPDSLIQELGLEDGVPSSVCAFLVKTDGKELLFDAANGAADSRLMSTLDSLGVSAEDIDYVFMTHLHGDHFGGLMYEGEVAFPNAEIFINKVEYDQWLPSGVTQNERLRTIIDSYGDRVKVFAIGDSLPCGVVATAAYGHTAGHTVYQVGDIMIVGDIMHGVALQKDHPDICASFDMDKEAAVASRKTVLKTAREKNVRIYGMHFPPPYYL